MLKIIWVTAVALTALTFTGSASAAGNGCFGAPADYVAAYDTVRGQGKNGQVDYPEPRVFLEVQGHVAPNDGTVTSIHHREHIHIGACFPEGETWVQANAFRLLDFRLVFHHVVDYDLANIGATWVDATGTTTGGVLNSPTAAQLAEINTAMDNSAEGTTAVFQTYGMKAAMSNGLKQYRMNVAIAQEPGVTAVVQSWFIQTLWWSTFNYPELGAPVPGVPVQNTPKLNARNWWVAQDNAEKYHYGGFPGTVPGYPIPVNPQNGYWRASNMKNAKPCQWPVIIDGTDGTNRELLAVDPNFHVHDPDSPNGDDLGAWHQSWSLYLRTDRIVATVPICSLGFASGSVHRLVYVADMISPTFGVRPISGVVQVIPFKVP